MPSRWFTVLADRERSTDDQEQDLKAKHGFEDGTVVIREHRREPHGDYDRAEHRKGQQFRNESEPAERERSAKSNEIVCDASREETLQC
jgi:hypothetical protein